MGESEFAAKDDLQSTRDVVYEHAQKLDELSQKIEELSQKLDQLESLDIQSKFNEIDTALAEIKEKVGS